MKKCYTCGELKPLSEFHKRKDSKDGHQGYCKLCNLAKVKKWQADNPEQHQDNWKRHTANNDLLVRKARRYNIDVAELQFLIKRANGVCEICKREPIKWLVVDHCHDSLKVRGILCEKCNQALGLFGDSVETLKNAIDYLGREPLDYKEYTSQPRRSLK